MVAGTNARLNDGPVYDDNSYLFHGSLLGSIFAVYEISAGQSLNERPYPTNKISTLSNEVQ